MNDWLDYKGSGSSRAYMGETLAHGRFSSMVRSTADKVVKEVGDVVTLPYDMSKLGKQMTAYANLINSHNDAYNKYISEANKYAKLCNNPLYITSYKSNKAQYDLYKSKAAKAKKDIDKVFKDAQADYEKLGDKISNNAIIGPIYRMIENIYSNLPAITEIATVSASNQIRSDSNISHALQFITPAETRKKEQEDKQRTAELRLYNSKAEKLTSDLTKLSDDISKHHASIFSEISRKQSVADDALAQLNAAKKSGNVNKIAALESKASTIVNDVNRDITEWNKAKDSLIQKVLIYDSRVTNLINDRPNNNYSETQYTHQAVLGLQNARNKLFYDRDILKNTFIYKITM